MKKQFFYWLAFLIVVVTGCQKEESFELGDSPAAGSLQSDISGDCLPKTVNGTYATGVPLVPTTNTITVAVNVTTTGTYVVTTDTVNGFYFRGVGQFTTLGVNTVTLRGNGTPFASLVTNFVVSFDSTVCDIQVNVTQPGVGTLGGAPNACAPISVNGAYSPGVALTAANNAGVQVNVSTPGAFNITTDTVDGIWFSFTGNLTSSQTVTLQAQGSIPAATAVGNKTFTVKLGTGRCTFVVNMAAPATGSLGGNPGACTPSQVFGTYSVGTAVNAAAADSVQIQVNFATAGSYNIIASSSPNPGFSFSASGITTATGLQTITLVGNGGVATLSGPITFTVTFGISMCTFVVNISPALSTDYFPRTTGSNWSYEFDDDPDDSLYRNVIAATLPANSTNYNILMEKDGITLPEDSSGYYRKNGGDYFEWVNLEDYGADAPAWVEYIMLKDNVANLTIWKTPTAGTTIVFGGTPTKIRFSNQILQKDVSVSITTSGIPAIVNYNNVIVVEQRIETEILPGVWQDLSAVLGTAKSYYARGIGLIKFELIPAAGPSATQELRRYQVL